MPNPRDKIKAQNRARARKSTSDEIGGLERFLNGVATLQTKAAAKYREKVEGMRQQQIDGDANDLPDDDRKKTPFLSVEGMRQPCASQQQIDGDFSSRY